MRRSGYVDFATLKQRVNILQVIEMLNLQNALKPEADRLFGCCPMHKGDDSGEFIITPAKGLWLCQGQCNAGGDMIELVARLRNVSVVQAARDIARHFAIDLDRDREREDEIIASPIGLLRPRHEAVQALRIRPETAKAFWAGYCPEGNCFMIPIFDDRGACISHVAVTDGGYHTYPEGFDGKGMFFNAHRIFPADHLYVTYSPLMVLKAHQEGIVNAVAIFGAYDAERLVALANFMRRKRVERVEFF